MYQIIDKLTGLQVGTNYKDRTRARKRADQLDSIYGGYRYYVKKI